VVKKFLDFYKIRSFVTVFIWGDINAEAWSSGWGLGVGLTTLPCKKKTVEKPPRNSAGF
jgi:hypothetical protein